MQSQLRGEMMRFLTSLIFTSIIITPTAFAQDNKPAPIKAYKVTGSFNIDGILDEDVYDSSAVESFTQLDPNEGEPVSEDTYMWVFYDESNLYICGKFIDSQPDSIDVALMRRDNLTASDWLWIYLDPYNDDRSGVYFAVNAGGSICDGTLYNDGAMDDAWDGIWESKSVVTDEGWNVEVRIPFSQLRFNASENMVWGINLNRDIRRKNEMSFYVMIPKHESGFNSKFADLVGLNGIKPKQRIELLPYIVQRAQYLRHDPDDPFYKDNQYNTTIGADLKFSLESNLNVDATFNPDFGQVEVDPAVLNLTAFETFYDEKRPFFIEGADIFRFGREGSNNSWGFDFSNPTLFYSRRIGRAPQGNITKEGYVDYPVETRIIGAAKLTGKIDETWSVGALSAVTERSFAKIKTAEGRTVEEEVEPFTHYGVIRTKIEFDEGRQGLGMILTSVNRNTDKPELQSILGNNSFTFGVDGWTFLDNDDTYVLTGSVIGSYVEGSKEYMVRTQRQPYRYFQRPDKTYMPIDSSRTSMAGVYSRVMLNKQKGNFYVNAVLGTSSPGFEYNDLGSQSLADRISGHAVAGYRWYQPDGMFRRKSVYLAFMRNVDYENNLQRQGFYTTVNLQFTNFYSLGFNSFYNMEAVSTTLTRGGPKVKAPQYFAFNLFTASDPRIDLVIEPYAGYSNDELGSSEYYYGVDFGWKPNSQIDLSVGAEMARTINETQWVGVFDDPTAITTYGRRYVFAEIDQQLLSANIRLNWTFTPTISLQLYVQPFFAVGNYREFKELDRASSMDYNVLGRQGSTISYNTDQGLYEADPDGEGESSPIYFYNPDFNFKSFRGNLVLRWEVLPGSVFYLVWTNERHDYRDPGNFSFGRDFSNLWEEESDNVFLAKFSYWIDI